MTHYSVPFSAVTRAIIDASKQEEHERRGAVTRVYESARIGLRSLGLTGLLKRLAADVQSNLYLFDSRWLEPWQEGLVALPRAGNEHSPHVELCLPQLPNVLMVMRTH